MKHWWNDTDREKPSCGEENTSHTHFVHVKSRMNFPGIELGSSGEIPVTYFVKHDPAFDPTDLLSAVNVSIMLRLKEHYFCVSDEEN